MENLKIENNITIVSAIVERCRNGIVEILVQTRWQEKDKKYSGTLEITAGWVEKYENVYDAISREVGEETGLKVVKIRPDIKTKIHSPQGDDASFAFRPFCCQQQLKNGLPWIGNVFLCEVEDKEPTPQAEEVRDIKWMRRLDIRKLLERSPEKIFTLQVPVLDFYFQAIDRGEIE